MCDTADVVTDVFELAKPGKVSAVSMRFGHPNMLNHAVIFFYKAAGALVFEFFSENVCRVVVDHD